MAEGPEGNQFSTVLVVETHSTRRAALEDACRAAGVPVLAVSSIAEVERWPEGQIVITDRMHLTRWWQLVGAVEVITLVRDAEEGVASLENGATRWLEQSSSPAAVAAMVLRLTASGASRVGDTSRGDGSSTATATQSGSPEDSGAN